jgi:ribonucleoside-diphosphate reductase alpha chain
MSERRILPQRRRCETFTMRHGAQNALYAITVGYYWDDRVGEVFISGAKSGSDMESVTHDGAILLSLALQYGVTLDTIQHAISRNSDGSAATIIGAVVDRIVKGEHNV